jgi:hypothetical protein
VSVLGVDPGKTGALALLDADVLWWVEDMPDCTGAALGAALKVLLEGESVSVAVVELVASRPGQGVASTFKFGAGYGALLGALGALGVRVEHVTPATWKRAMKVSKDKDSSRQRARELWPGEASRFARVKDDGRAEACLIAEWWLTGEATR